MGIKPTDYRDLVANTTVDQPRKKFAELVSQTDFPGVRIFFEKQREMVKSGLGMQWSMRVRGNGSFRFVRLYDITPNNVIDVMARATAPWAMHEMKTQYDERETDFNNSSDSSINQLVDQIEAKDSAMYDDGIESLDLACLQNPINAADDLSFLGLTYWLPKLGSGFEDTVGGFNGIISVFRDGSTTTSAGGVDRNDPMNIRTRSYNGTYSRIDQTFFDLLRRAQTRTNFKLIPELKGKTQRSTGQRWLLGGHGMCDELERYANLNDPSGSDVMGVKDENYTIRGMKPMRWPAMDTTLSDSLIGVYTKNIYGVVLAGQWMKKKVFNHGNNPNIVIVQIDGTSQIICDDAQKAGFHLHRVVA